MKRNCGWMIAAAVPVFLFSCSSDDNPANTVNASPYATACKKIIVESYMLTFPANDSAIAINPAHTDTGYICAGNTLLITQNHVAADTSKFHYFLTGNYLNLIEARLEAILKGGLGMIIPMDGITLYLVYKRQGSGTGLNGVWMPDSIAYQAHRQLNIYEKAVLDSIIKEQSPAFRAETEEFFEIRGNTLTTLTSWNAADQFLEQWADDSAGYAITAQRLNDCEVKLTGTISGEIVTVSGDSKGNVIYRGNSADMPEHIYYPENPRVCPNTLYPSWWQTFLDHNARL